MSQSCRKQCQCNLQDLQQGLRLEQKDKPHLEVAFLKASCDLEQSESELQVHAHSIHRDPKNT
jgi:hypothetical protein